MKPTLFLLTIPSGSADTLLLTLRRVAGVQEVGFRIVESLSNLPGCRPIRRHCVPSWRSGCRSTYRRAMVRHRRQLRPMRCGA